MITLNHPYAARLLLYSSLYTKLAAVLLDAQLHQTLLFYAKTEVLPDGGPIKFEICRSTVCFLNIIL
jgi:hypothetical protein